MKMSRLTFRRVYKYGWRIGRLVGNRWRARAQCVKSGDKFHAEAAAAVLSLSRWSSLHFHCPNGGRVLDLSLFFSLSRLFLSFLLAHSPHRSEACVFLSRVRGKRGGRGHARVITSRNMDRLGRLGGGTKTRGKIYF